jgi:hypothetical protein
LRDRETTSLSGLALLRKAIQPHGHGQASPAKARWLPTPPGVGHTRGG